MEHEQDHDHVCLEEKDDDENSAIFFLLLQNFLHFSSLHSMNETKSKNKP